MAQNPTLSFENATGTIDYPLTNDFIFHLSRIDLTTEEDKHYQIDQWAKLLNK